MSFITDALGITGQDEPDYSQMEFKPYSISGPTGGVSWSGRSGTVNLSPELQALYAKYTGAAEQALPSEEQLSFAGDVSEMGKGLFARAAGTDINAKTRDYYNKVLESLEPQRAQEESRLADTLFKTGRTGAAVGYYGGGYINPEQFSLFKAREEANKNIYLGAEDRARQQQMEDIRTALGTYGTGQELRYQPYQTSAGLLNTGINLANINSPYVGYGLQAGTAGSQAGANIVNAQQQYADTQMGFWGDLLGGVSTVAGGVAKGGQGWSNLFKW